MTQCRESAVCSDSFLPAVLLLVPPLVNAYFLIHNTKKLLYVSEARSIAQAGF
jgi:hypothetical protein